jgi:hypothetical protein
LRYQSNYCLNYSLLWSKCIFLLQFRYQEHYILLKKTKSFGTWIVDKSGPLYIISISVHSNLIYVYFTLLVLEPKRKYKTIVVCSTLLIFPKSHKLEKISICITVKNNKIRVFTFPFQIYCFIKKLFLFYYEL